MKIAWIGHSCFRMLSNGMTFVTDPFDETFGYKMPDIIADVVTESHQHHDHNAHLRIKGKFVLINDDGEYRVDGCSIRGIKTYHDESLGIQRGNNTVYIFSFDEGIKVVHMGDIGHAPDERFFSEIGKVDILMIHTGGIYTVGPEKALRIVNRIEPKIVIPMHYKTVHVGFALSQVDEFLASSRMTGIKMKELDTEKFADIKKPVCIIFEPFGD